VVLLSSTAHAQALKAETVRLSSLVIASVIQRDADADVLSEQRELLDDTTDADAARLADSLAELAAGRKADDANVKERTVALKAEFAAIVAELARVEKKHASKFAKLTAAADTMRAETEDAAAAQQRRADSLAEAMLRQTNNQQTSYETMRVKVQRTVEQLHQTEFERRADAERLLEQLRQSDVERRADAGHAGRAGRARRGRGRRAAAAHRTRARSERAAAHRVGAQAGRRVQD
jgi:hypothetical protein